MVGPSSTPLRNAECLRYWDLCSAVSIDAAVALWCDVEPGELKGVNFVTNCMSAKREAIIDALRSGRLDYQKRGVPRSDGRGMWYDAAFDELIEEDGVRIDKDSLRRWFLEMPFGDRPAFLFDESRQLVPSVDGGQAGEMTTMRALAVMAWMLSQNKPELSIRGWPNAAAICNALQPHALAIFGNNTRGFASFDKKIRKAIELLPGRPPFAKVNY